MKHIIIFLSTFIFFVLGCEAQTTNGLNVNGQFFPYEMLDSISYTRQGDTFTQNIWYQNEKYSTTITSNESITSKFEYNSDSWFLLEEISDFGIYQAYISSDIVVLAYENEFNDLDYCVYPLNSPKNKIFIVFNDEHNIDRIISEKYCSLLNYSDSTIEIFTFDNANNFCEDILPIAQTNLSRLSSRAMNVGDYSNHISNISNIINNLMDNRGSEASIWGGIGSLASTALQNLLPLGGFYGFLVDNSLDLLRKAQEDYENQMLQILYGNCSIELKDLDNDGYSYSAKIVVSGCNSLPRNRYNNKNLGVYFGLVGEKNSEPKYEDYDFIKGPFFTLEDTAQEVALGSLDIDTHYYVTPYLISYNQIKYQHIGNVRYGNTLDFVTPKPSGIAIEVVEGSVTETCATIKCAFSNIAKGVICGIEADSEELDIITVTGSSSNGEQEIQLSGLQPATLYKCYAYVQYNGKTEISSEPITLMTDIPSIAGTWNVTETYSSQKFPGGPYETLTRTYTLTLEENGKLKINGNGSEYIDGRWGYSIEGEFSGMGYIIATNTQTTWDRFSGKVDDVKNPQRIEGTRIRGNMNQVVNVENFAGSIVMTR